MFFCNKCRYSFNITKDVQSKQIGGKINEALTVIFNKYKKNEPIEEKDLLNVIGKDITDDERFEMMSKKDQRKMVSTIKAVDKNFFIPAAVDPESPIVGSNVAYFICKFCKNNKPIKPQTLIYSKNYNTTIEVEDYTFAVHDQTLPRTRNYICKNPKCKTHTDPQIKEAVLTKNSTEQIVYICTVCLSNWINQL